MARSPLLRAPLLGLAALAFCACSGAPNGAACAGDSDCLKGSACFAGHCVQRCGTSCDGLPRCGGADLPCAKSCAPQEEPACACPGGQAQCAIACSTYSDCPDGGSCQQGTGACNPASGAPCSCKPRP